MKSGKLSNKLFFLMMLAVVCGYQYASAESVNYYYGKVHYSSPDGKIRYGQSSTLLKRIVKPKESKIVEIVIQPSQDPKKKIETYVAELVRVKSSNTFNVTDNEKRYTGTVIFSGEEWKWNKWTYSINLASGGRITGTGEISGSNIKANKLFFNKDKKPTTLIKESGEAISLKEYQKIYNELIK